MAIVFVSHSSQDDAFVRDLRAALADHGSEVWIDSRELRGGDPLWEEIQKAIENASACVVIVSQAAFQSNWVGDELTHALKVQRERGRSNYPIIPVALDGTKLGVFKQLFGTEPVYISVSSDAGGVETAMNSILVASGKRLSTDDVEITQPKAEPLEELVLELTDLKFHEQDGVRRASARARLVYEPASPDQPDVHSVKGWRLIAPIGPIEAEELSWYLEKYAIWPSHYFRDRARKVEENLVKWGQLLYDAAMPVVHTANVMSAWAKIGDYAGRRFSVYVDTTLEDGMAEGDVKLATEAATLMLALPWELLHDGDNYLFQGAKPVRVRRRLPNLSVLDVPVVTTPIRILLVTARPEDESCSYIDHRVSALPLVEAMESLPGLVNIHVLSPATLPALRAELDRARRENKPYHVFHFDGHGVFNREVGLGGLCFENPEDTRKLEQRRHETVFTDELGPILRDHRIPLVFLEACQTAQAEKASESVGSELLRIGVASVVAMSHSLLVETARRFVEAFYGALADGKRVGDAMLQGQRQLKDDTFRGRIFGAGELRLEDWFVPVLYQEKDDPQLFKVTPTKQTQEDFQAALAVRLGDLPPAPETGFIGRSRELLALQRLLREERYAVVRGQGGEGKTALAAEFARWMVRSQQMRRAAFVSVETHSNERSIVDALGKQLVQRDFSAAGDLDEAIQQVERALREQPALLVIDNMESVLLPPFMQKETPEPLFADAREELKAILALCERFLRVGDTKLIFTSTEALPAPFETARNRRELHQLYREDAVKLLERVLNAAGSDAGSSSDAAREEIEALVEAVHCHARTLALLAPSLREQGVEATRESLVDLMVEMESKFPGSREKSVFTSVELSLRRMSEANRERSRVLAVFHGGMQIQIPAMMMKWEEADALSLANELIEIGLATPNPYNHLTLNPALCVYLRMRMDVGERETLTARWVEVMRGYVEFLEQHRSQNVHGAATLSMLELPNLFALLDLVQRAGDSEATIRLATSLLSLLQMAGKPKLVEQIVRVRDSAAAMLGDTWNHAQFEAARTRIEEQLATGHLQDGLDNAQQLLLRTQAAGERAYPDADYDLAMACNLVGQAMEAAGGSEQAFRLFEESRKRFEAFAQQDPGRGAEGMASACLTKIATCLRRLGRIDEAAAFCEEAILRAKQLNDDRGIVVGKGQLGTARMLQHRYSESLQAFTEALEQFTQFNEPSSVAVIWHQMGNVYQATNQYQAAEEAYQRSLTISARLGDVAGQAATLAQIGSLYDLRGSLEEAEAFYYQALEKYVEISDVKKEGFVRNNLAKTLCTLQRFAEANEQILRAIECGAKFGHAAEPWKTWSILADIETKIGDSSAASVATRKAIECYLDYRRDGGENHFPDGRLSHIVTESLLTGDSATATSLVEQPPAEATSAWLQFYRALQDIVSGSRDRTLADGLDLEFSMAAEILFLIETLEGRS